jgi:GT2 family glycosyltransferase
MVDNSKTDSYAAKLRRDGINAVRVKRGRNSRDALANASNYLRKRALDGGYDYLLMLESDIFPESNVIERLLSIAETDSLIVQNGKRVIGVPYAITDGKQWRLCVFITEKKKDLGLAGTRLLTVNESLQFMNGELQRVHGMGVGCVLIHRSVLENIVFWYSELDDDRMKNVDSRKHPDVYFYIDMHNNNIPVYCDTSQYAIHKPSDWKSVSDI